MSQTQKRTLWFPLIATAIFSVFMTLMVVVLLIAYSRKSGRTGLDVAQMHLIRAKATEEVAAQ